MRNDSATSILRPDLTAAAVEALERLRNDLGVRHRIPGARITANAGTAFMALPGLSVVCHGGSRFTWDDGFDEHRRAVLGKAPAEPLHEAADHVAARYRQVHGHVPPQARQEG